MTEANISYVEQRFKSLVILLASGQTAEAIQLLREILEVEPRHPIAMIQLGELLRHTSDILSGVELLRKGLKIQPNNVVGWLSLASALRTLGQPDGAQAAFCTVLDLDPGRIEALNDLGTLMMDQSDWGTAVTLFERASNLSPSTLGIRMNLARALAQDGRSKEALEIAEAIAVSSPSADFGASQLIAELRRPMTVMEASQSLVGRQYNLRATGSGDQELIEPELASKF